MKNLILIVCALLAVMGTAQAKEPVNVLYHGNIHIFKTPAGELRVEVHLPDLSDCRLRVVEGADRKIRKGVVEKLSGEVSPDVQCGEGVGQLLLRTNSIPAGWEYKGSVPIPRQAQR